MISEREISIEMSMELISDVVELAGVGWAEPVSGPGVGGQRDTERSKRGALSWQSNPGDLKLPNEYFIGQTERRIGELHSVNLRRMTRFLFCLATSSIFIWIRNSEKIVAKMAYFHKILELD